MIDYLSHSIKKFRCAQRNALRKLVLLLLTLLLLTACPAPGPECVYADDWGQFVRETVIVEADTEFTDSGVETVGGEPLYMKVSGSVDLCPDGELYTSTSPSGFAISPTAHAPGHPEDGVWQNTGVTVRSGDPLSITIGEGTTYNDRNGTQTRGKGLYALIHPAGAGNVCNGTGASAPDSPNDAGYGGHFWWPSATGEERFRTVTHEPQFFELWDNGSRGDDVGGFSGAGPVDGCLWFKYARTADARSVDNSGDIRHSPWRGRYGWHETHCPGCLGAGITCALFPLNLGTCGYATWCLAENYIADTHKCEEQTTNSGGHGDHWVDGDYGTNSGGYEITVGSGCLGTRGRYMQAIFASSAETVVTWQDLYAYPDGTQCEPPACARAGTCSQNSNACAIQTDPSGAPIQVATYNITSNSTNTMSMDSRLNANINSRGEYGTRAFTSGAASTSNDQTVPVSGTTKLWFKIEDNFVKPSDARSKHPTLANCEVPAFCMVDPGLTNAQVCTDVSACVPPANATNPEDYRIPWGTRYTDNLEEYEVEIITTKIDRGFSSLLKSLVDPIREILFGVCTTQPGLGENSCVGNNSSGNAHQWRSGIAERLYLQLASFTVGGGGPFIDSLRAALVLYIVVYGFMFGLGMIQDVQTDFVARVFRIAIVAQLLHPGSWEFFYGFLFTFFVDGMNELIGIMAGDFMGAVSQTLQDPITGNTVTDAAGNPVTVGIENPFVFVDQTVSQFFSLETMIKIAGLLFASPIGWLYILLIFIGMYYYIFAILKGLVIYLLAMIAIALLLAVAPIFIAFLLFKKTRDMFDGWVKQLINFLAQPVLVFTALSIFNVFVYSALYMLLHYDVCWQCILNLNISPVVIPDINICLFTFYAPWGGTSLSNIPIAFFMLLIFMIICDAMLKLTDVMAGLAAELTSGAGSTSLAKTASGVVSGVTGGAAGALKSLKAVGKAGTSKAKKSMKGKRPGGPKG